MKKVTFVMLAITFGLFLGLSVFSNPTVANTIDSNEKERDVYLNIITCNKLQYNMVKSIVGDKHNVEFMFLNEKNSYDFKYTNETIDNISNMDLFFYSGNQFEPWSNSLIGELKKGNLGIINVSRGVRSLTMQSEKGMVDNPYYWTGLEEYKVALYNIKSAIQDRDPKNRTLYDENYNKTIKDIDKKMEEIKKSKESIKEYSFIALDDKLDYFYKTLGITPIKVNKDKPLEVVIKENNIKNDNLIILKDINTQFDVSGYKVVDLVSYDGNLSAEDTIIHNMKLIYENIPLTDN